MKTVFAILVLITGNLNAQSLKCDNQKVVEAYQLAINTVEVNVRRGVLAAGADYGGEWARDAAMNAWNGVSLINPKLGENSLWSVTANKDSISHQYWDRIIWVIGAYNQYKVTGDKVFLKQAYSCSVNSMKELEKIAFDSNYGLFTGPSVFNDGISGYPAPIFDSLNMSHQVLEHKNSKTIKCLSTNCIYYGAYKSLIEMGQLLNADKSAIAIFKQKADALKSNILKYMYSKTDNTFYYLIDNEGTAAKYQEGLGISYSVMFGVLDGEKAKEIIRNAKVSVYGITSIYPDFPRYSPAKPGRHNNLIWPIVNGYFAQAAILTGNNDTFTKEFNGLTQLAIDADKGDYNFREVYNPYTGAPDGGWQGGSHGNSMKLQTWSATAYMSMIYYGLAGMKIENESISFAPFLPENIHYLEFDGIKYRDADLKIRLKGTGSKIKSFLVNGNKQSKFSIDAKVKGVTEISIELE